MQWQLFSQEKYANLPTDYCLPIMETSSIVAFAIGEYEPANVTPKKIFSLTQAPPYSQRVFPVACYSWQDLQDSYCWQKVWQVCSIHIADIAHYASLLVKKTKGNIDSKVIMESCGWPLHFKNVERWQELGKLGEMSRKLARKYNFNLRILRLWNRLQEKEQQYWLSLWNTYNFGQNIVREIICYYYELAEFKRQIALNKIQEIIANWKNQRQLHSRVFPYALIRNIIYELHSPHINQAKKEIYQQKSKFEKAINKEAKARKVQVNIVPDLEITDLVLQIKIKDLIELQKICAALCEKNIQKNLKTLLETVYKIS